MKNLLSKSRLRRLLAFVPHRHNLDLLARKHGTDKFANRYTKAYQRHFAALRRKRLTILEIGVGGGSNPAKGGASLRMWKDYFPRSKICGIDIHDKSRHEERRIEIFRGDQSDPAFLEGVVEKIGRPDIVIDDGSHVNEHVKASFHVLFPGLADGGIYAIEDLSTSYWPEYGGEWKDLDNGVTAMAMIKRLVDGLHYNKIPNYSPTEFDGSISSIHLYHSLVFLIKGKNRPRLSAIDEEILAAHCLEKGESEAKS